MVPFLGTAVKCMADFVRSRFRLALFAGRYGLRIQVCVHLFRLPRIRAFSRSVTALLAANKYYCALAEFAAFLTLDMPPS